MSSSYCLPINRADDWGLAAELQSSSCKREKHVLGKNPVKEIALKMPNKNLFCSLDDKEDQLYTKHVSHLKNRNFLRENRSKIQTTKSSQERVLTQSKDNSNAKYVSPLRQQNISSSEIWGELGDGNGAQENVSTKTEGNSSTKYGSPLKQKNTSSEIWGELEDKSDVKDGIKIKDNSTTKYISPLRQKNLSCSEIWGELDNDDVEEKVLTPAEISLMKKVLRSHLLDSSHEVEVLRRDSRSPLYSVKTFEQLNLPPNLLKGVYAMGFNAPSKIQETSLPTLMADPPVNIIAQSQNGTGKTAAFVLSSLYRVNIELQYPQVLILAPTYELATQIGEVSKKMAQFCHGIEFRYAVKGENLPKGHKIREHVLIGTPGKVFDWSRRHNFFDLQKIAVFVLDEADIMISVQGHHDQCLRIHRLMSQTCQMMLFSATYTAEVMQFAEMIIRDPIIIRLKREEESLDNVKQYYIECNSNARKYISLGNIYGVVSIGQCIIFCRTKRTAAWLGTRLTEDGHCVGYLSSDLEMCDRLKVLTRFREGKEKVLITTNVCARGIDIEQVTIVINFDLPVTVSRKADCETYLHRIGRSGRFGKQGIAINMVGDEKDLEILQCIEGHFGKKIIKLDADDVDALENLDSAH